MTMRVSLFSVPVELEYTDLLPTVQAATDVFVSSIRTQGQLPVMPKIAIVNLIKWMQKHGFDESQYDFFDIDMLMPTDKEIVDYLTEYKPEVIGLSAVVSTSYAQVKRISELIHRTLPDTWIVLGGSLTASANLVLRKTKVDICVVGDGEIAWVKLLRHLQSPACGQTPDGLENISGLAYLNESDTLVFTGYGEAIPGNEVVFPDYEILKSGLRNRPEAISNYFRRGLGATHFQTDPRSHAAGQRPMLAQLWTTKGCVARCTFCQRSTKGSRSFDLTKFDDHLKMLATQYDVGFIHILDENFGSDASYSKAVAEVLHQNGMLWMASGLRVTSVDRALIQFYKDHGCSSLKFGVESGSQKILNVMEKKFTVERVYDTLNHCAELDIYSPLAVMVGMPGEDNTTAAETGQFVGRLCYLCGVAPQYAGVSIFYALPLTGTPLYVYGQQAGIIGRTPDEEEAYLLSVSGTGANKVNYVNLNGASMWDVVWWDWLVRLEAYRTYQHLLKTRGEPRSSHVREIIIDDKKRELAAKALTLGEVINAVKNFSLRGIKSRIFYLGDWIMENTVVHNPWVSLSPRWLVYPPLKLLVYLQYRLQGVLLRLTGRKFNLWSKWPHVKQLKDGNAEKTGVDIKLSLRKIVQENSASGNKSKTVEDILSIGL